MISSKFHQSAWRIASNRLKQESRRGIGAGAALGTKSSSVAPLCPNQQSSCKRHISSDRVKEYQDLGYLDEYGLTKFDTLHEMQVRSCAVYAENDLFGTHNPESDQFEYITYKEFENRVNACRSVLHDLGKYFVVDVWCRCRE